MVGDNDIMTPQVTFSDLAFLRFAVTDTTSNHLVSQRIVPIDSLKPGYRHLRLRNPQNQPLALSSLFIYTSSLEEGIQVSLSHSLEDPGSGTSCSLEHQVGITTGPSRRSTIEASEISKDNMAGGSLGSIDNMMMRSSDHQQYPLSSASSTPMSSVPTRRRMLFGRSWRNFSFKEKTRKFSSS